jgi:hypothetical protein
MVLDTVQRRCQVFSATPSRAARPRSAGHPRPQPGRTRRADRPQAEGGARQSTRSTRRNAHPVDTQSSSGPHDPEQAAAETSNMGSIARRRDATSGEGSWRPPVHMSWRKSASKSAGAGAAPRGICHRVALLTRSEGSRSQAHLPPAPGATCHRFRRSPTGRTR